MATLLLRLAAPLQAWGADSKFETRKTNREPTKSGGPTAGSEQVTNRTDEAASDWIHVPGFGRLTYPELEHYVDTGAIIESYDERTGKYTYRKA